MHYRKVHIVGNWKMNQTLKDIEVFFSTFHQTTQGRKFACETWIAPQAMHLLKALELASSPKSSSQLQVGAQNIGDQDMGAFTGENSPLALKDLGASFTLIGHSERRVLYGESDQLINRKICKALEHQLTALFCVGETLEQRQAHSTMKVMAQQLEEGLRNIPRSLNPEHLILAYEPVWAIGTGKTATPEQAQEVHENIRQKLAQLDFDASHFVILYGGSVKAENIEGLLSQADIDGALVGGASLKASDFAQLCQLADNTDNRGTSS